MALNRIDPSYKSHNASEKYPTMDYFVCAHVCTFLLQSGVLWDMRMVHCWICAIGLLIVSFDHDIFAYSRICSHRAI